MLTSPGREGIIQMHAFSAGAAKCHAPWMKFAGSHRTAKSRVVLSKYTLGAALRGGAG